MGTRLKEDKKSEKIIRSLLKQPANSTCVNCSSRGPQYICTTFWTFVCTTCSGIHREFTHRVKSVSMAKFTPEEINYLQAGGNERAKEIYFKEVDLHRVPDSSNVDRLRDFIKHVYVDRRYTGEKITGRPSIVKMGNREEPYDNRRRDSYQGNQQNNVNGRSPIPTGIINNWRREDRFANGKRSEEDPKFGAKSSDNKKDLNGSNPPAIRPITDILGESSISLHVIEPPRTSSEKKPDGSSHMKQQTASSKSLASSNENPSEIKPEVSLIDFDADPQPPVTAPVAQPQQSIMVLTTADNSDNWDFLDSAPHIKAPEPAPNSNPLDSVLTQLSIPPQQQSFFSSGQPIVSQVTIPTSGVSSSQGLVTNTVAQVSQTGVTPSQASSEVAVQPVEVKSSGRKELPADFFTAMYVPQPVHAPHWHTGLAPGVSFPVQYNTAVAMATFPQSTKSTNPFDFGSDSSPAQAPEFLPMTSLQNALPNMSNPTDSMHTSSLGVATPSWMPSQPQASPYPSGSPQFPPSFGDNVMSTLAPSNPSGNPFG